MPACHLALKPWGPKKPPTFVASPFLGTLEVWRNVEVKHDEVGYVSTSCWLSKSHEKSPTFDGHNRGWLQVMFAMNLTIKQPILRHLWISQPSEAPNQQGWKWSIPFASSPEKGTSHHDFTMDVVVTLGSTKVRLPRELEVSWRLFRELYLHLCRASSLRSCAYWLVFAVCTCQIHHTLLERNRRFCALIVQEYIWNNS